MQIQLQFKHRPDKEGIKTSFRSPFCAHRGSNTDLIKKGLRLTCRYNPPPSGSNTDLIKKGLRRRALIVAPPQHRSNTDLIKKGLRPKILPILLPILRSNTDLIKKGLRRYGVL